MKSAHGRSGQPHFAAVVTSAAKWLPEHIGVFVASALFDVDRDGRRDVDAGALIGLIAHWF